jgi:DNA-binding NarL/FixJ family response regulator
MWAAATGLWDGLDRPYLAAQTRWREAEAHVARGDREAAAAVVSEALEVARRLGARWLIGELDGLAARARLRLGSAAATPAGTGSAMSATATEETVAEDPFGLTARERQVLALLAEGATNREIGARLYMAEKTASVHVSRILAKLDVRSRTQAAAVAHRLGLDGAGAE